MPPRPRAPFAPVAALVGLTLFGSLAPAGAEPAADDQEACAPDVFRLCSSAIPNEAAIVACLNAHVPQLNPRCRAVIDPPKPAHRRRDRRS